MRHSYLFDGFFNHYWLLILTGLILTLIIISTLVRNNSQKNERIHNPIDEMEKEDFTFVIDRS